MSSAAPKVSFVLPCYNYARFLPDCLDSIFRQDGVHEFEIVAVNDASSDNTLEVLSRYADPRLRIVRHERNRGHAECFTSGLNEARGELIARIDPDDRYRSCFLNRAVPVFQQYPEVGMVYGNTSMIGENGEERAACCDRGHGGKDYKGNELIELLEWNFICAPTIVARRDYWLRQLPIPSHLAFHDWYFTVLMARETEFYYIDEVLADYRVHGANLHTLIARNKSEERSVFWLLDYIYSMPESSPGLQARKMAAKARIYSKRYLDSADKYFGAHLTSDARRCYLRAVSFDPSLLLDPGVARRLAASLAGRGAYERLKAAWKRSAAPKRAA